MARTPLSSSELYKDFIKFSWSGIRWIAALENMISNLPKEDKSSAASCRIKV